MNMMKQAKPIVQKPFPVVSIKPPYQEPQHVYETEQPQSVDPTP
jgi:hypothetical protein